ncbi:MAG: hypothetical protein KKH98_14640 [Spirochaetes bacterium]|nr:hypothetical protein [Spirochaetota bacterium]
MNTNYNMPVPVEYVTGTTVAGPEAKQADPQERRPEQADSAQKSESAEKGGQVDRYA